MSDIAKEGEEGGAVYTMSDNKSINTTTSYRHVVKKSERKFDVNTLPADMRRVYHKLAAEHGEEYGLLFIFNMRTAIELHRAWHMTLLTSKILQQVKDRFGLRMTWNLGVVRLKFRVEDGGFELHRKVPYDYDSEYQDIYMRIAVALVEGNIGVHEALIYQTETKQGLHTAKSGLFLRDFPGRIVLYPALAATCAVIFFGGDGYDAGVAAVCGVASAVVEYLLGYVGGEAKILIDVLVGIVTGIVGSLFYRYDGENVCLSAVFLGNLYWFFYGTAFVIGILEIICGELETGVTRFIAVSVKTFVLSLGAGIGMMLTLQEEASQAWIDQNENCNNIDLGEKAWRIPLYLACSVAVLGQYRTPIVTYWRGLIVMLAAYEVQYLVQDYYDDKHPLNNLDTAASNILGAMAAVTVACVFSFLFEHLRDVYYSRLLERGGGARTKVGDMLFAMMVAVVKAVNTIGIGRQSDIIALELGTKLKQMKGELRDPAHPRTEIILDATEEKALLESIVSAENRNIWAILMPALYQLVPGSMIAKLWFNSIFPPPLLNEEQVIPGTNFTYTTYAVDQDQDNVFSNLMVISTSLALGLILGFAFVQGCTQFIMALGFLQPSDAESEGAAERQRDRLTNMLTVPDEDFSDRLAPIPEGEIPTPEETAAAAAVVVEESA